MKIERTKYVKAIEQFINQSPKSILLLDGPRFAGKSTLLDHTYTSDMREGKRYYYSFDEHIGTKQFKDTADFMQYMQIKYGVDFSQPWLLLLNEIQYSKNIGNILHDLIKKEKTPLKIIATSITQGEYKDFLQLHSDDYDVLTVHTLSFLEFLNYKWFHTEYVNPYKFSPILAQELQPLLKEFLSRWAYPSVIIAATAEEKKQALQNIINEIFIKDVSFWFSRDEIGYFETIMQIINAQHEQIYNKLRIKNTYDIPLRIVDKYMRFLEDNYLITTLQHFSTDKTREVSHKQKAMMLDMGIKNYFHDMFSRNPHDYRTMIYMSLQEIYKSLAPQDTIMTYKKINWSQIELIVEHNKKLYPIVIWERNTSSLPKVYEWFVKRYNKKIWALYKTSSSTNATGSYEQKEFHTLPYYLIGMVFDEKNK